MLVNVDTWCERLAASLPKEGKAAFRLDLLRRSVRELENRGVKFQYLPHPAPKNINYSLSKIKHDAVAAFKEPDCEGWSKNVAGRIEHLREALRAEGLPGRVA